MWKASRNSSRSASVSVDISRLTYFVHTVTVKALLESMASQLSTTLKVYSPVAVRVRIILPSVDVPLAAVVPSAVFKKDQAYVHPV